MSNKEEIFDILDRIKCDIEYLIKNYNIKDIYININDNIDINHIHGSTKDAEVEIQITI